MKSLFIVYLTVCVFCVYADHDLSGYRKEIQNVIDCSREIRNDIMILNDLSYDDIHRLERLFTTDQRHCLFACIIQKKAPDVENALQFLIHHVTKRANVSIPEDLQVKLNQCKADVGTANYCRYVKCLNFFEPPFAEHFGISPDHYKKKPQEQEQLIIR